MSYTHTSSVFSSFVDVMTSLSGVTLVLFCSVFILMLSLKPQPFVQWFSICWRPDSHKCFFFSFCSFGDVAFSAHLFYHCRVFFV